jgi:hypothetical protein
MNNRLIDRVKQPHSNSERSSTLAGIPLPSKPASERGLKVKIERLNLILEHENNHRALRQNKRSKSGPQTEEEHQEPNPPLASKYMISSNCFPP